MKTSKLKTAISKKQTTASPIKLSDLLSTGSTLLNLCCSGKTRGGFAKGTYIHLVGDSASGKTFLSMTCFAEAMANKEFENYRLVFDDAEGGALMDIERFFGKKVAERIEPPKGTVDDPKNSSTVQEFFYNLTDNLKQDRPCLYVLDSMDAIDSDQESKKFDEQKQAYEEGKTTAGTYGVDKAKAISQGFRRVIPLLRKSKSILIIISQTRDNLGFGFEPKTSSGGRALRFYAGLVMWSSIKGTITKTVKGKPRQLGIISEILLKKNRLTGKLRKMQVPISHSHGIDDTESCIDYLIDEGHWTSNKKTGGLSAPEFDFTGNKEKLIRQIEENDDEPKLRKLVGEVWNEIEEATRVERKKRYA